VHNISRQEASTWDAPAVLALRKTRGENQQAFAAALVVNRVTVSEWERGAAEVSPLSAGALDTLERETHRPPSSPLADTIARARLQTEANVIQLGEISGIARAVLTMLEAVTDQQRLVVNSLSPWVHDEEDMRQTIAASREGLGEATPAVPAGARPAGRQRRAGGE